MRAQTVTLNGEQFVILSKAEYDRLRGGTVAPRLPPRDAKGNYPAAEAMRVTIARTLIRRRRAVGLSQVALARRAGVRTETVNRLEHGKHTPSLATLEKLQRTLDAAEREQSE